MNKISCKLLCASTVFHVDILLMLTYDDESDIAVGEKCTTGW